MAGSALHGDYFGGNWRPARRAPRVAMNRPVLIVLTAFVLAIISTLAVMNAACKSSPHAWCAPISSLRHHARMSTLTATGVVANLQ